MTFRFGEAISEDNPLPVVLVDAPAPSYEGEIVGLDSPRFVAAVRILGSSGVTLPSRTVNVAAGATGALLTISHMLGSSSTLSLLSGSSSNLTISGSTISATAAIAGGSAQLAIVREQVADGAIEYRINFAAAAATGTPTPTPTPAPTLIAKPALTPAGTTGEWNIAEDASYFPGYFWNVQRAVGSTEAIALANLAGGTLQKDVIQQIQPDDLVDDIPIIFTDLGATPSGAQAVKMRVGVDDGLGGYTWGSWSDAFSVTVPATANAVLVATTGVNKNQYISVDGTGLVAEMNNAPGTASWVRTVTPMVGKTHMEFTFQRSIPGSGFLCGIVDGALDLNVAGRNPGGSSKGCTLAVIGGYNKAYLRFNGGEDELSLPSNAAPGDVFAWEVDPATALIDIWHSRFNSGTETWTHTLIASRTLTAQIPDIYTACLGGAAYDFGGSIGDKGAFNAGATAFAKAPRTGYSFYGS